MEDYGKEYATPCGWYTNSDLGNAKNTMYWIVTYKCKGVAKVVRGYGSDGGCYNNGGHKTTVYGFYWDGLGYWFSRKSDAMDTARWVLENNWNAVGDLEAIVRREGVELKKVYF